MNKVIHLITSLNLGGAEVVAIHLAESFQKADTSFVCELLELYPSKSDFVTSLKQDLDDKKIKYRTLSFYPKKIALFLAPIKLVQLIRNEKPDIIHSHTDLPDFVLSVTCRILRALGIKLPKIIRTVHNTELWSTHKKLGLYVEKALHDDAVVAISNSAMEAYLKLRRGNDLSIANRRIVIYNGLPKPLQEDLPFELNTEKINFIFCGRFELQKGIDILLKRIEFVNRLWSDKIDFYLIGSGSFTPEVLALKSNHNNVFYSPPILNIANKLHHFDFLLMFSRFEGLGLCSIEASLAKVPVIASRVKGLTETLPDKWELSFDLESEEQFIMIVNNIIDGKFVLETIKEKAFTYVKDKFSLKTMTLRYWEQYNYILEDD